MRLANSAASASVSQSFLISWAMALICSANTLSSTGKLKLCLLALSLARNFPAPDLGPADLRAFALFAALCFALTSGHTGVHAQVAKVF